MNELIHVLSWTGVYILLHRIVYPFLFSKTNIFKRIPDNRKIEWYSSCNSTAHSIFVLPGVLYFVLYESQNAINILDFTTPTSVYVLLISMGYMITDTMWMLIHREKAGYHPQYVLHHLSVIFSYCGILWTGKYLYLAMFTLLCELSPPFTNLRWQLKTINHHNTKLYALNATMEISVFFITRIFQKIFFWIDVYTIQTESERSRFFWVQQFCTVVFGLLNLTQCCLWFYKISKGYYCHILAPLKNRFIKFK